MDLTMRDTTNWRGIVLTAAVLALVLAIGFAGAKSSLAQAPDAEEIHANEGVPEVEIERRFNEMRREVLDDRADALNWWLSGVALLLTVLVIGVAAGGYLGVRKLQAISTEARESVETARGYTEEARKIVDEMRQYGEDAGEVLRGMVSAGSGAAQVMTGEDTTRDLGRVGASAIAEARQLGEDGRIEEAIDRWRQIANVAAGSNDELAALAHKSVGDLSEQKSRSVRK